MRTETADGGTELREKLDSLTDDRWEYHPERGTHRVGGHRLVQATRPDKELFSGGWRCPDCGGLFLTTEHAERKSC